MIVIDASALLELLLQRGQAQAVARRMFGADVTVHAPHLIDLEVAQVLRRLMRRLTMRPIWRWQAPCMQR